MKNSNDSWALELINDYDESWALELIREAEKDDPISVLEIAETIYVREQTNSANAGKTTWTAANMNSVNSPTFATSLSAIDYQIINSSKKVQKEEVQKSKKFFQRFTFRC